MHRIPLNSEVSGRAGCDLAVEVHRQWRSCHQPDAPAGEVVNPLVLYKFAVLERTGNLRLLPQRRSQDRIDVQGVIVNPRCWRDRIAAAVVPSVPHCHLKQVLKFHRLVIPLRELKAGVEGPVLGVGAQGSHTVCQGADQPFEARAERLGDCH